MTSRTISQENHSLAADVFLQEDALKLLKYKKILILGDSNMRATYKDIIWLVEYGSLIPNNCLRTKNELSHAGDKRLSNGCLTSSRYYVEVREYSKCFLLHYEFLTRIYSHTLQESMNKIKWKPDFIIINCCVWDLSRWGPNGIAEYKVNVKKIFSMFRNKFKDSSIIFTTTMPISLKARGGFLTENIQFLNAILPFSIVEANKYVTDCSAKYQVDIIDLYHYMQHQMDHQMFDGIHWDPLVIRYITNIILTHLSVKCDVPLPKNIPLLQYFDGCEEQLSNSNKSPLPRKRRYTVAFSKGQNNYYNNTYDFHTY